MLFPHIKVDMPENSGVLIVPTYIYEIYKSIFNEFQLIHDVENNLWLFDETNTVLLSRIYNFFEKLDKEQKERDEKRCYLEPVFEYKFLKYDDALLKKLIKREEIKNCLSCKEEDALDLTTVFRLTNLNLNSLLNQSERVNSIKEKGFYFIRKIGFVNWKVILI